MLIIRYYFFILTLFISVFNIGTTDQDNDINIIRLVSPNVNDDLSTEAKKYMENYNNFMRDNLKMLLLPSDEKKELRLPRYTRYEGGPFPSLNNFEQFRNFYMPNILRPPVSSSQSMASSSSQSGGPGHASSSQAMAGSASQSIGHGSQSSSMAAAGSSSQSAGNYQNSQALAGSSSQSGGLGYSSSQSMAGSSSINTGMGSMAASMAGSASMSGGGGNWNNGMSSSFSSSSSFAGSGLSLPRPMFLGRAGGQLSSAHVAANGHGSNAQNHVGGFGAVVSSNKVGSSASANSPRISSRIYTMVANDRR